MKDKVAMTDAERTRKHRERRKEHPHTQRGGESQGCEPIQNRFDCQQAVIARQSILDRT